MDRGTQVYVKKKILTVALTRTQNLSNNKDLIK